MQTQSTAVTSTMSVEQLKELPLVSRNALYAVALLPGVETAGGPRGATISGLPNNTVNITIDGISTGNMLQSTDGFFSMVTPRLDAVEEITVTGAVPGRGRRAGLGADRVRDPLGHQPVRRQRLPLLARSPSFNSNYYFNKVNDLDEERGHRATSTAAAVGGPIVIPGPLRRPQQGVLLLQLRAPATSRASATRTRTILQPEAQAGIFGYNVTVGGVQQRRTVDLLALARGQRSDRRRSIRRSSALLDKIRAGTHDDRHDQRHRPTRQHARTTSTRPQSNGNQYAPTTRVDFNLTRQAPPERHLLVAAVHEQRRTC